MHVELVLKQATHAGLPKFGSIHRLFSNFKGTSTGRASKEEACTFIKGGVIASSILRNI